MASISHKSNIREGNKAPLVRGAGGIPGKGNESCEAGMGVEE
jgi:hypothetical protein